MVKRRIAAALFLLIGIGSAVGLAGLPDPFQPAEGFPVEELLSKLDAYAATAELPGTSRSPLPGGATRAQRAGAWSGSKGAIAGTDAEASPGDLNRGDAAEPDRRALQTTDDLAVLRDIIAVNGLDEGSSAHDHDNGDGVFEPHELGVQRWEAGRLVELRSGPDEYLSFGYALESLPPSIGNLSMLRTLDLHSNRLRSLPETIGFLHDLRELRLYRNALRQLPRQIWGLRRLVVLSLGHNRIEELPSEIGELTTLRELHLNDNPLRELPGSVGKLANLEVLALQKRLETEVLLLDLPPELGDLVQLSTLYLSGNALYCDPDEIPMARFLRAGNIPRLYGLDNQECP